MTAATLELAGDPALILIDECGQSTEPENVFTDISAGSDFTCGINDVQALQCWGDNSYGQASPP